MSDAPKETRNQQIDEAAEQLLRDMDVMVDKLAPIGDTLPNETVSGHVAREAAAGKHWACVFCKFLSWGVERDHCEDTLAGDVMPWWVVGAAALLAGAGIGAEVVLRLL